MNRSKSATAQTPGSLPRPRGLLERALVWVHDRALVDWGRTWKRAPSDRGPDHRAVVVVDVGRWRVVASEQAHHLLVRGVLPVLTDGLALRRTVHGREERDDVRHCSIQFLGAVASKGRVDRSSLRDHRDRETVRGPTGSVAGPRTTSTREC